jgi:hypothetical protein
MGRTDDPVVFAFEWIVDVAGNEKHRGKRPVLFLFLCVDLWRRVVVKWEEGVFAD